MKQSASVDIRPSPLAGRWYPADPTELARSIDAYLDSAQPPQLEGEIVGLLAPHAGHQYSGAVAGYAFKLLQGLSVEVVALVGPSHHRYDAAALVSGHEAYHTPLGDVPIARDIVDILAQQVPLTTIRHDPEHALEIELPFLQRTLGDFEIVPLALLDQSWSMAQTLGTALAHALQDRATLLIASSDLSHFYPQRIANTLDNTLLEAVAAFDPAQVIALNDSGEGLACGHGAIAAIMVAARALGATDATRLHYATSGAVSGNYDQVVGYGAAAFTRPPGNG